jgi:hypothetical protein
MMLSVAVVALVASISIVVSPVVPFGVPVAIVAFPMVRAEVLVIVLIPAGAFAAREVATSILTTRRLVVTCAIPASSVATAGRTIRPCAVEGGLPSVAILARWVLVTRVAWNVATPAFMLVHPFLARRSRIGVLATRCRGHRNEEDEGE